MMLSVPIQLFIKAQQEGFKNELRFFLLLKLLYPEGKTKLNHGELAFIELELQLKSRKTTKKQITKLIDLGFLTFNNKTQYYIIKSFDKIRVMHHFETRLAFSIGYHNYNKLEAVTGAILYGYLHKDFWRKFKKRKSVPMEKGASHFSFLKFNTRDLMAPVSVYGVQQIFDIPIATASRLKKAAKKAKYLKVKQNFDKISIDEAITSKRLGDNKQLRYKKGKYYLRLVDTVCPLFYFKKRKPVE